MPDDLTPELLEQGRLLADQAGTELEWPQADAPHHQASADELVRVLRPGGRVPRLRQGPLRADHRGLLLLTARRT